MLYFVLCVCAGAYEPQPGEDDWDNRYDKLPFRSFSKFTGTGDVATFSTARVDLQPTIIIAFFIMNICVDGKDAVPSIALTLAGAVCCPNQTVSKCHSYVLFVYVPAGSLPIPFQEPAEDVDYHPPVIGCHVLIVFIMHTSCKYMDFRMCSNKQYTDEKKWKQKQNLCFCFYFFHRLLGWTNETVEELY